MYKALPAQRANKLKLPNNSATSHDLKIQFTKIQSPKWISLDFSSVTRNGLVTTNWYPQELYEVVNIY